MAIIHVLALEANSRGGGNVYTFQLIRRFAKSGHDVHLIAYDADPAVNCVVHRLPRPSLGQLPVLWRAHYWLDQLAINRSVARLPLHEPDVVIASHLPFLWPHRQRFRRSALVYLPHALAVPLELKPSNFVSPMHAILSRHFFSLLERWALARAAATVRFTRYGCQALRAAYGDRVHPRFVVNPVGIDLPSKPIGGFYNARPRLLFVGRLVASKNVALLLEALAPHAGRDWTCDVVGEGDLRPLLEEQARRLGLQGHVRFHGHQESIAPWYRTATAFVFPSLLESLGLVVLEAMSHGLPVLVMKHDGRTQFNAYDEFLIHGQNGLLARDPADFASWVGKLLDRPGDFASLGQEARSTVERQFNWPRHLACWNELIDRLTRKNGDR
jgi:glycosyltransferase involved in cell wall biosynthesis